MVGKSIQPPLRMRYTDASYYIPNACKLSVSKQSWQCKILSCITFEPLQQRRVHQELW
jgi:hypothetical protein